jgi:hypothetical protein
MAVCVDVLLGIIVAGSVGWLACGAEQDASARTSSTSVTRRMLYILLSLRGERGLTTLPGTELRSVPGKQSPFYLKHNIC